MLNKQFDIDSANQQSINELLLDGKFEEAQNLLKKTMSLEKEEKAKDTVEVLGGSRSAEACALAEASNGKIILRPDGKIDFPELGIKGMGRLSVDGPTDLDNGLVQGGYQGSGIRGLTYITGERAMKEVMIRKGKGEKIKLLPANGAIEKIKTLLSTLGSDGAEQTKALQLLFGSDFSGYWYPFNNERCFVGSVSYLGLSEVDVNEFVTGIDFNASDANIWDDIQTYPMPFLTVEEC